MDLKDVVEKVNRDALEALNAFHAGHHDTAEKYLYEIEKKVVEYLRVPATPAGDVTKSATSETSAEKKEEKLAQDPGSPAQPAATPGADAAEQMRKFQAEEKQTQ